MKLETSYTRKRRPRIVPDPRNRAPQRHLEQAKSQIPANDAPNRGISAPHGPYYQSDVQVLNSHRNVVTFAGRSQSLCRPGTPEIDPPAPPIARLSKSRFSDDCPVSAGWRIRRGAIASIVSALPAGPTSPCSRRASPQRPISGRNLPARGEPQNSRLNLRTDTPPPSAR